MGDARSKQEKWKKAIKAYKRAIKINPNFSWSHHNLGEAFLNSDRFKSAVKAYQHAIQLNPNFKWSSFKLGQALLKVKRFSAAVRAFERVYKIDRNTPWLAKYMGDALRGLASVTIDQAIESYKRAIAEDINDLTNYQKALDLRPNDSELNFQFGRALERLGHDEKAMVFYHNASYL